jgi:hypothetical protein
MGSRFGTTLSFSRLNGFFSDFLELGKQGRIIIKTSDTDVIVLCIYFYKQMKTPVICGFKWETLLAKTSWSEKTFTISRFPNESAM